MNFMDMECFKEINFKYRVKSAIDFRRIKFKRVVFFSVLFRNDRFIAFLMLNTKYMLIYREI